MPKNKYCTVNIDCDGLLANKTYDVIYFRFAVKTTFLINTTNTFNQATFIVY